MKRLAISVAVLACGLAAAPAASAAPYVVTLEDSVGDVDAAVDGLQHELGLPRATQRYASALKGFAVDLGAGQAAKLARTPGVAWVEPDAEISAMGMQALAAGEAVPPGIRRSGGATPLLAHAPATTAVAVLDTGVDLANQELDAVTGVNCVKPGTPAQDDNGHGTNVAGIVAARNTGKGVVGVAPGTRVYAVKVLNNRATGTLSQFLCGINWVAANAAALNIRVANMSIGGAGRSDGACGTISGDSEHKAICAAAAAGVTFVVSAGNGGTNFSTTVPAAYPEVLTATAITDTDGLPGARGPASCAKKELDDRTGTYSSYAVAAADAAHAVAAPGTCITSAGLAGNTATYTGTSQAAPHIAGAVALCVGSGGLPGPCAGLAPAQVIARVRADATGAATLATGFLGDPLRPLAGKVFGPLVTAAQY
jgi:subtilisin